MADNSNDISIDDIYSEYGVYMHHSLFAGAVIERMARALLGAHNTGYPLPSSQTGNGTESNLDPSYDEFVRMKRIGLPDKVIIGQMLCAGIDVKLLFPDYVDDASSLSTDFLKGLKIQGKHELKRVEDDSQRVGGPHSECAMFRELLSKRFNASEPELFQSYSDVSPQKLLRARRDSIKCEDTDSDNWSSSDEL